MTGIGINHHDCPLLVEGMPTTCADCEAPLCLRKQVINLALGNGDKMCCLVCLAKQETATEQVVLRKLKSYIEGRDCFAKEWLRYDTSACCPDWAGCFPEICFVGR